MVNLAKRQRVAKMRLVMTLSLVPWWRVLGTSAVNLFDKEEVPVDSENHGLTSRGNLN